MTSSRGRSTTACMASSPFRSRLSTTCCSWTGRRAPAGDPRRARSGRRARVLRASPSARATTSRMTSLMSNGSFSVGGSAREGANPRDHVARPPAVAGDGLQAVAHFVEIRRRAGQEAQQALALMTTPESGWSTSCAIDAAISPSVVTRATWARSACACRSASSACLRSVMS